MAVGTTVTPRSKADHQRGLCEEDLAIALDTRQWGP